MNYIKKIGRKFYRFYLKKRFHMKKDRRNRFIDEKKYKRVQGT